MRKLRRPKNLDAFFDERGHRSLCDLCHRDRKGVLNFFWGVDKSVSNRPRPAHAFNISICPDCVKEHCTLTPLAELLADDGNQKRAQ